MFSDMSDDQLKNVATSGEHLQKGAPMPPDTSSVGSALPSQSSVLALDRDVEKPSGPTYEQPLIPTWRLVALSLSLCMGLFLSLLDTSIVATALFSIGSEFNNFESVNWIALAYTLAYVGCAVLFARFSDVIGRRNANVVALVIFIAFSIGCGFAQDLNQLIAFRAIQGVGGSGLYSLTIIVLPEIHSVRKSKLIGSMIGMVIAVAGVMGPVVGGIITHETTWRWIFWINGPIGILALALFVVAWPKANQMLHIQRSSITTVDFTGGFLLVAASVLVVFAFQEAGFGRENNVWQRGVFVGPIVAGGLCWILLFVWEAFIARFSSVTPLLPGRLLGRRVYSAGTLCTITTGFVYFVVIYSMPVHFAMVYGKSSLVAGISLLPLLGSAAVGSVLGGTLGDAPGARFLTIMSGSVLIAVGAGLLSTVSQLTLENKVYGFQVLVGLGFGVSVSNISAMAARESRREDVAVAQGIVAQARILGGSIGIAASSAILGVIQRRELVGIPSTALSSPELASHILTIQQLTMVRQTYADAFVETMRVCAIIGAVGFVFSFGSLERKQQTSSNDDEGRPP